MPESKVSTEQLSASRLFDVKDWVVVVTGGGTGIGLMISQAFAANGAKVYITSRRGDVLEDTAKTHTPEGAGQLVAARATDVTSKDDLVKLYKEIESKEDHVDLLVCASGVSGEKGIPDTGDAQDLKKKLWDAESFEGWDKTWRTDVSSVYFTSVVFLPLLQAASKKKGDFHSSIITISSMSGYIRDAQGHFSYNAAKAATIHLTKMMSKEFKDTSIRVNSIAPGYFPSEMTAKESDDNQKSDMPAEKIKEKGHVPQERAGTDEEMAQAALFLAKCIYVQGQILTVDGGVLDTLAS